MRRVHHGGVQSLEVFLHGEPEAPSQPAGAAVATGTVPLVGAFDSDGDDGDDAPAGATPAAGPVTVAASGWTSVSATTPTAPAEEARSPAGALCGCIRRPMCRPSAALVNRSAAAHAGLRANLAVTLAGVSPLIGGPFRCAAASQAGSVAVAVDHRGRRRCQPQARSGGAGELYLAATPQPPVSHFSTPVPHSAAAAPSR